jgi:secreted trypsin-like serine protease
LRRQILNFRRFAVPSALVAFGLFTLGCSGAADGEASAELRAAIVNGEVSDENDDAVVMLLTAAPSGSWSSCTATMVAPNLIITALHCVSYFAGGMFSCNADGTIETSDPGSGDIGAPAVPEKIEVFTGTEVASEPSAYGARVFGTGAPDICRNDLALVLLDRSLDLPLATLRMDRPMETGELMTVVGYGSTGSSTAHGRERRAGVKVLDVGPLAATEVGTTPPRTFVLSQGACYGDSGGPAFSESTGALSGVFSLAGNSVCTASTIRNTYTRISPFRALIEQAFLAAGADPIVEFYDGPPEPTGNEPPPENPDERAGGSGSRDSGCVFAGSARHSPFALVGLGIVALGLSRRRAARPSSPTR